MRVRFPVRGKRRGLFGKRTRRRRRLLAEVGINTGNGGVGVGGAVFFLVGVFSVKGVRRSGTGWDGYMDLERDERCATTVADGKKHHAMDTLGNARTAPRV